MLQGVVILLSVVSLVKCSQSCWGCSNERDIAVCRSNTVICSADEQCFVEKVVNDINQVVYNAGCRSNAVCQIMQSLGSTTGKRSVVVCGQCCSGQNCQDTLCGGSTQVGTNQLTCLSCNDATSASTCLNSEVCQDTEVCVTYVDIIGSQLRYTFGCKQKHVCKSAAAHDVVGHPGRDVNGVTICSACCVTDQCNRADCFLLKKNMTVSMFST